MRNIETPVARTAGALLILFVALAGSVVAAPSDSPVPWKQDPAIREVLTMTEAGVGADVMQARLRKMEHVPVLDGDQIAELKSLGVPDTVLLAALTHGRVMQEITTQHVLIRPRQREIKLYVPRRLGGY